MLTCISDPLLQQQITSPAVVAAGFKKPYPNFPDNGTLAQSLRPFPQFLNVWSRNSGQGQTWYDAATIKVQRRFGAWQFTSSYVRSKSLALLTYRQIFSQNQVYPQDMYNLTQPKSYLPFDCRTCSISSTHSTCRSGPASTSSATADASSTPSSAIGPSPTRTSTAAARSSR